MINFTYDLHRDDTNKLGVLDLPKENELTVRYTLDNLEKYAEEHPDDYFYDFSVHEKEETLLAMPMASRLELLSWYSTIIDDTDEFNLEENEDYEDESPTEAEVLFDFAERVTDALNDVEEQERNGEIDGHRGEFVEYIVLSHIDDYPELKDYVTRDEGDPDSIGTMPKMLLDILREEGAKDVEGEITFSNIVEKAVKKFQKQPISESFRVYVDPEDNMAEDKGLFNTFNIMSVELYNWAYASINTCKDELNSYSIREHDLGLNWNEVSDRIDAVLDTLDSYYDYSRDWINSKFEKYGLNNVSFFLDHAEIQNPPSYSNTDNVLADAIRKEYESRTGTSLGGLEIGRFYDNGNRSELKEINNGHRTVSETAAVIRKIASETADLLNLSVKDNTLRIDKGMLDYIPSEFFSQNTRGIPFRTLEVENGIKEIDELAVNLTLDRVVLPNNITLDYRKALSRYSRDTEVLLPDGSGVTHAFNDTAYGLTPSERLLVWNVMNENHVPVSLVSVKAATEAYHKLTDAGVLADFSKAVNDRISNIGSIMNILARNYCISGFNVSDYINYHKEANRQHIEDWKGIDKEAFQKKFRYVPKRPEVLEAIAVNQLTGQLPEDFVERFDGRICADALRANVPLPQVFIAMNGLDKEQASRAVHSPYLKMIADDIAAMPKVDDKTRNWVDFVLSHGSTNSEFMREFDSIHELFPFNKDTTIDQARTYINQNRAIGEISKIKQDYPDFSLDDLKCELKNAYIHQDGYYAHILKADDPRQVMLGYDTDCCQHLNGAGETAMMYGLYGDKAGFFVIENEHSGKVLAQGETWEADKDTLVFDNLEFADDRQVEQFAPILAKWAQEVDYKNVYMGTGYNELAYGKGIRLEHGIEPPEINELDPDDVYTDADEKIAVIKEGGQIEPYFNEAYRQKEGKNLASDKEKSAALPSLDEMLGEAKSRQHSVSKNNFEKNLEGMTR